MIIDYFWIPAPSVALLSSLSFFAKATKEQAVTDRTIDKGEDKREL